jgi:hypothetical protein
MPVPAPCSLQLTANFLLVDLLLLVSLLVPLPPRIDMMKKGAILLNVSRGGLVNSDALINGLENNTLSGVGMDVYENEGGWVERKGSTRYVYDEECISHTIIPWVGNSNPFHDLCMRLIALSSACP